MSERNQERREQYQRVRTDFDDLETEEKVVFLLEATVSTVARGIDEFGRAVSDEINKAFSRRAEKKARHGARANGESTAEGAADASSSEADSGPSSTENADGNSDEPGSETP